MFVWCLLGAAQACGRAVGMLERGFGHHQAVVIMGEKGGGGGGRAFLCASCGLVEVRGIFKRFEGEHHSVIHYWI